MKRGAESDSPSGANESEAELNAGGTPALLDTDEQEQGQPKGDSVAAAPSDSNPATTTAAAQSNTVTSTKEQTKARRENGLRRYWEALGELNITHLPAGASGPSKKRPTPTDSSMNLSSGCFLSPTEPRTCPFVKSAPVMTPSLSRRLRTFLSKLLHCDPMRISKKFVGSNCIGKQVFRRRQADMDRLSTDDIKRSRFELAELERRFLSRVAQTNRTAKTSVASNSGNSKAKPTSFGDKSAQPDFMRQQPISAPWLLPPHPDTQALPPVRATPGAGAVAIAAPYGLARAAYQQQWQPESPPPPEQQLTDDSLTSAAMGGEVYRNASRDAYQLSNQRASQQQPLQPLQPPPRPQPLPQQQQTHGPLRDAIPETLTRPSVARNAEIQRPTDVPQLHYNDNARNNEQESAPRLQPAVVGNSGDDRMAEGNAQQHATQTRVALTRLERQRSNNTDYVGDMPARGSHASLASIDLPSLNSMDNLSCLDTPSLGAQSPWPSSANLVQPEAFVGLSKSRPSEASLGTMENGVSDKGRLSSWPSFSAFVGGFDDESSANAVGNVARSPYVANQRQCPPTGTVNTGSGIERRDARPSRQATGDASATKASEAHGKQRDAPPHKPRSIFHECAGQTKHAAVPDGNAAPATTDGTLLTRSSKDRRSGDLLPNREPQRHSRSGTAQDDINDRHRPPPPASAPQRKATFQEPISPSQTSTIRHQHRNSSVDNFFSLVANGTTSRSQNFGSAPPSAGDIPAPDADLLTSPILQQIASGRENSGSNRQLKRSVS